MRKLFIIIVSLVVFLANLPFVNIYAEENDQDEQHQFTVVAPFDVNTTRKVGYWELDYDDAWFETSSFEYQHSLARLSLAMAVSSFRPVIEKEYVEPAENVLYFLDQCGFTDTRVDDYDKNPTLYTVSSVIGNKVVQSEDGDYTVIAIAVCGGGYTNEWMSNFTIGNGDEHEGFSGAAQKVFDRLFGYIAENQITGPIKIWCAGYSRAAAITNLLAKKLDDSNYIDQNDIFAYTFATPNTTKNAQVGNYQNIWNVCGKMDPVTQMPLGDWGYTKYGNILYTPAEETDSAYMYYYSIANDFYQDFVGTEFWNNVDLNIEFRVILSYLLKICPDTATYEKYLQDKLIEIWEDKSASNIISTLMDLATNPELINEDNIEEANGLLNYISYTLVDMIGGGSILYGWNSESTLLGNMAHEHTPEVYVSWMMATDNPDDLFSDNLNYTRLVVTGNVDVQVLMTTGDLIHELKVLSDASSNNIIEDIENTNYGLYMERRNGATILMIPNDDSYKIVVRSNIDQEIGMHSVDLVVGRTTGEISEYITFDRNQGDEIYLTKNMDSDELFIDGGSFDVETDTFVDLTNQSDFETDSPDLFVSLERVNLLDLTWRETIIYSILIPVVIVAILIFLILTFINYQIFRRRKKKGRIPKEEKYRPIRLFLLMIVVVLFVYEEIAFWLMRSYFVEKTAIRAAINLCIFLVALVGYFKNKDKKNLLLLAVLLVCGIADAVMINNFNYAVVLQIIAMSCLAIRFYLFDQPEKWQYLVWLVLFASAMILIKVFGFIVDVNQWLIVVYAFITTLVVSASLTMPRRIRMGAFGLLISSILLFINETTTITFVGHLISLGLYYVSIALLATSTKYKYEEEDELVLDD